MTIKLHTPQFQAFTLKSHGGRLDRIVTDLGVSKPFDPNVDTPDPKPPIHRTSGLWDTGATRSVVTKTTASALGLIPTSLARMTHAGGVTDVNVYIVNLYLPNRVMIHTVSVMEMEDTGEFGVLIGMDVITLGDFSITNYNDITTVSFRYPSIKAVDYVVEHNSLISAVQASPKVERNEPCPCGSGRKYKNCHGRGGKP